MHPQAAGLIRQYITDLITRDCVTASDPTWTISPIVWRPGPTADESGVWVGLACIAGGILLANWRLRGAAPRETDDVR